MITIFKTGLFDYSDIGYRLTYQGENLWIYKKDSKVIDDLISNMK